MERPSHSDIRGRIDERIRAALARRAGDRAWVDLAPHAPQERVVYPDADWRELIDYLMELGRDADTKDEVHELLLLDTIGAMFHAYDAKRGDYEFRRFLAQLSIRGIASTAERSPATTGAVADERHRAHDAIGNTLHS